MSDFSRPFSTLAGEWKQIYFPKCGAFIPSRTMINDLLVPRSPTYTIDLLAVYQVPEVVKSAINNLLIEHLEEKEIWRQIMLVLQSSMNNEYDYRSIYIFVSRNYYRIQEICEYKLNSQSFNGVLEYSNHMVQCIEEFIDNPSDDVLIMNQFCKENKLEFEVYHYNFLVKAYCYAMLPYPYKTRGNNDTLEQEKPSDLAISIKRTGERFPCFLAASRSCLHFFNAIEKRNKETQKEFDLSRSGSIANDVAATRKLSRELRNTKESQYLYQCPFCFEVSIKVAPPQGRDFSQCCDQPRCLNAYGAWKAHLKRCGLSTTA
jgi:hypothetical protein